MVRVAIVILILVLLTGAALAQPCGTLAGAPRSPPDVCVCPSGKYNDGTGWCHPIPQCPPGSSWGPFHVVPALRWCQLAEKSVDTSAVGIARRAEERTADIWECSNRGPAEYLVWLATSVAAKYDKPLAWLAIAGMLIAGHLRRPGWWVVPFWALSVTAIHVAMLWSWWAQIDQLHGMHTPPDIRSTIGGWERRSIEAVWPFLVISAVAYGVGRLTARRDPKPAPKVKPLAAVRGYLDKLSTEMRLWLAFSVVWLFVVGAVTLIFEPFGYAPNSLWVEYRRGKFLAVLIGPVLVSLLALRLVLWATRNRH